MNQRQPGGGPLQDALEQYRTPLGGQLGGISMGNLQDQLNKWRVNLGGQLGSGAFGNPLQDALSKWQTNLKPTEL